MDEMSPACLRRVPHAHRSFTTVLALVALAGGAAGCGGSGDGGGGGGGPTKLPPQISTITPDAGATSGDTAVTIKGANFRSGAAVTIAGATATSVAVVDATTITARTSSHGAGTGDVIVTEDGQSAILPDGFTYALPAPSNNPPPVIKALVAKGSRKNEPERFADLGETIGLGAAVIDAETPGDALVYRWTASAGTISGSGASVSWTAPATATTPATVTVTLTVLERFVTNDTTPPRVVDNTATGGVTIALHDSVKEVGDMATRFLTNFSQSTVPVDVVMQDFLPGCYGTSAERADVEDNRREFLITSWTVSTSPTVTVNFDGTCPFRTRPGDACSASDVEWHSIRLSTNANEGVTGVDQVAAVYRGDKWWLCDSQFNGRPLTTSRAFFELLSRSH